MTIDATRGGPRGRREDSRGRTPDHRSRFSRFAALAGAMALAGAATVAGVATTPAGAAAQAPDTLRQDTVYPIEPIAVRALRPSTTPGGVSAIVVRLDSVRFRAAPLLEDVLREIPLVQIRTNSRGEATIALRGAEERQIAVLLDGIPLTIGWDHRTDLSVVPLTAAQRVELVRGLSSVLHGPNVLGGVVEIDMTTGQPSAPAPLRLQAGLDDQGGYALAGAGGTRVEVGDGRLTLRGGAGYRARDGFAAAGDVAAFYPALGGDGLRANSDLRHLDGFVTGRYDGPGGGWLSASALGLSSERGVPPELDQDGPRLWRYPSVSRDVAIVSAGSGDVATPWGTGSAQLALGLDLGSVTIDDYLLPADPLAPGLRQDAFYSTVDEREASDDRTVTARALARHSLGGSANIRLAGTYADVVHDEVITTDMAAGTPQEHPARYRQRLWSVGSDVEVPFPLGLGPFRSGRISAGVAYDGADTPETGGFPISRTMGGWGGRLGASAGTEGGLLVHASVSRRGRFPALREMFSAALGKFQPNPDLKPEILTGVEAGFTTSHGALDLQVVGFHQQLDDAIVRGAPPETSTAKYMRVNRDAIRSTGLEVLTGYGIGRLALEAELTVQNVEVVRPESPGVRAEYEPAVAGGIGGTAPLFLGVELGAEVEYMGRQYCSAPQPGQESYQVLDPSTRGDIQLARTFQLRRAGSPFRHVGLELAVDNVTDAGIYDQCGLPQPGRTVRLQLRLN